MEHTATKRNRPLWPKLLILAVFVGALIAFFALGGKELLSLETLQAKRDSLLSYTENHYVTMLLICAGVYAGAVAFSLPGAIILSLTVGLLFGRWVGGTIIIISATVGATLVFLAARYLFADAAERWVGGRAKKIIEGFQENAFNYLLFLRLVPVFPFWLVNLVAAITSVKLGTYVLATFLGIIPGSFIFANLGQSLGRIESLGELWSKETIAAFVLLGLFALAPILIKKLRTKKTSAESV